jgi:adenine-specific DNA-methyltransferase
MIKKYHKDLSTIYQGNCIEVLKTIPDNSIDLIFADPPYNIGKKFGDFIDSWPTDQEYADWCFEWMELCIKKLKPSGSFYVMTSTQAMPYLDLWLRDKMTILSRIVWHYDSSGVQAKKYYGSLYEPILYAVKDPKRYIFNASAIEIEAKTGSVRKLIDYRKKEPTPYKTTKVPGNTWYMPRVRFRMGEYENHPSQKPEQLLERIIKASSNYNDIVLDPFGGTFSTGAVARKLNRQNISIEINEEYLKIGLRRLGISETHNGEFLKGIVKNRVQKNRNGMHGAKSDITEKQLGIFDDN